MPRIVRGLVDSSVYHVINRGNGGQKVFNKVQDYKSFIDLIGEAKKRHSVEILAYCLMPNHFHFVLKSIKALELSKFMQWLMTSHVRRYHKHYRTYGHVWQGRFKNFLIQQDEHLLTVLRYVEGNPVRAGLVASGKDCLWSSHPGRLSSSGADLLDRVPIELPGDWGNYVDRHLGDRELSEIRRSVNRQCPYGTSIWQNDVAKELGLESTMKPRGRPRKQK